MKVQHHKDLETLNGRLQSFPTFAKYFFDYKLAKELSPSTLLEYSKNFFSFFNWIAINFPEYAINHSLDINISHLEMINVEHIQQFESHLRLVDQLSARTTTRRLQAVRSLFNYLHDIAEDTEGYPLLKRNVFRKIPTTRVTDALTNAREIQDKTLNSKEADDFIDYIRNQYQSDNSSNVQAVWNYNKNGIRDICIINLMLRAGLLVSDIVNLNIHDISLNDNSIKIHRQWSGRASYHCIYFGEKTAIEINSYLKIRTDSYQVNESEEALFLALKNGQSIGKRMTKRAIQSMVIKYSNKYGENKITTRQLRHSFGINHHRQNSAVDTKTQLALRNLEATEKYQILTILLD
ncbi:tyrosine recombinase XerS [Bifidobacterium pullorum subsp. gallinarum]